jgi:hypothetical protein
MTREDDALAGHLVRRFAPEGGADPAHAGDACPGDGALAALLEGRLEGRARTEVERHLVTCAACGAVIAEAAGLRAGVGAGAAPILRLRASRRRALWAAAAVLAVGTGAAVWALARPAREGPTEAPATLAATAASLRAVRPDLFHDFRPLSAAEIAAVPPTRLRGGLAVVRPAETVLARRPAVEWVAAPGATGHVVVLATEGGKEVWRRAVGVTTSAVPPEDAPDLEPGTGYVVRVEARGPLGASEATRRFVVADEDARERFLAALGEIERRAPPHQRAVLGGQFALRRGLLLEAERLLAERLASDPDDAEVQATLRHVRRRLGVPED